MLAGAALFGTSSVVAYQDAAALAEIEVGSTPRWKMYFLAAPATNGQPASLESFDLSDRLPGAVPGTMTGRGFTISSEITERPRQTSNDLVKAARLKAAPRPADPAKLLATLDLKPREGGATPDLSALPSMTTASVTTPIDHVRLISAALSASMPAREEVLAAVSVASREEDAAGESRTLVRPRPVASPAELAKARKCMAEAIYFEARGEPDIGQYAVAQVVMNRVRSGYYPDDVCGVVYENKHLRNRCQFSFACDGIPDRITNKEAWKRAEEIAKETVDTDYFLPEIGSATHYHATYVHPHWTWDMDKLQKIGKHIFYRDLRWGSDEG
jgi:spore germination cell wall hydrolase CwlJ-like protein